MSQSDEREVALNEFTQLIRERLKHSSNYSFRSVNIDGVLCYPVIYKHRKIVNFECINIDCEMTNKWGDKTKEKYSVYYKKYKSIKDAILTVELVCKSYRIHNGDLISPRDYKMAKAEERFLPYNESQVCCVCYESTLDTTVCDHYLCLRCREVCLKKCVNDCPMCRNPNVVSIYNIDNGLINNIVHGVLREVLEFEKKQESPHNIFAFIDRIGNRRIRTPSSESAESDDSASMSSEPSSENLSEVSTIYENDLGEESDDLLSFDISVLFEAASQIEPLTIL